MSNCWGCNNENDISIDRIKNDYGDLSCIMHCDNCGALIEKCINVRKEENVERNDDDIYKELFDQVVKVWMIAVQYKNSDIQYDMKSSENKLHLVK